MTIGRSRPRILVFAYACEPDKGSEPGAGWAWTRMLATFSDVVVITRSNNRVSIDHALATLPERQRLGFVYVDLPLWARRWKRGQRGVRLYYLLWQVAALRAARRVSDAEPFDLYWHVTFANGWIGTLAALAGRPFVYGPIGGGIAAPWQLLSSLGWRGCVYELFRSLARFSARHLNPVARLGWARADLVLVQNPETLRWLPAGVRRRAVVFPNATLEAEAVSSPSPRDGRRAIYAGRLLPWKGLALALHALAVTDDWTLTVCGDGFDQKRLSHLAGRLGVGDRVRFLGWHPRSEVLRCMREEADLLLFPSLHEDAGFAIIDALASGVPVVCLAIGGPPVLARNAGTVVGAAGSVAEVVARLAAALCGPLPDSAVVLDRARELTVEARSACLVDLLAERRLIADESRWEAA